VAKAYDIGEALYRAISNGRSPHTEPNTLDRALRWYVKQAGSVAGAARLAGMPRRSFRDWLDGKSRPRGGRSSALIAGAIRGERRARLTRGREKKLRQLDPQDWRLEGAVYTYDGVERNEVLIGHWMGGDPINALVDAFLGGSSIHELRGVFVDHIQGAPFYEETMQHPAGHEHGWTVEIFDLGL
jgi:hypothetical protein